MILLMGILFHILVVSVVLTTTITSLISHQAQTSRRFILGVFLPSIREKVKGCLKGFDIPINCPQISFCVTGLVLYKHAYFPYIFFMC